MLTAVARMFVLAAIASMIVLTAVARMFVLATIASMIVLVVVKLREGRIA